MKKRSFRQLLIFLLMGVIGFGLVQNPLSDSYVEKLRLDAVTVSATKDPLYGEILQRADEYEKKPSDAKVDKIWKKMPGYNGLRVDVEASYKKMKKMGKFDERQLVFKQVAPAVHLDNLPPAPIYRGHPEKPMVAITINVAWGNEYLSSILTTLKEHNVSATFFLEGRWAKQNPDLVQMIHRGGHEIGNHSYSHPDFKVLGTAQIKRELMQTNEIIEATIGVRPTLFAPPSGSFRDEVVTIAHEMNMETIMWTVDTVDWQNPPPHVIINRVVKQVHNGAIILMHPTNSTAKSLHTILTQLKNKGYKAGNVSQLLDEKRIY